MRLFSLFRVDKTVLKEKQKEQTVDYIVSSIVSNINNYSHTEQTEILNRVTIRIMERKKEKRSLLIKEARELSESMADIKII